MADNRWTFSLKHRGQKLPAGWARRCCYTTALLRIFSACDTSTELCDCGQKPLHVFHNRQLYRWDTPLGNKCLARLWQNQQIPQRFLQVPGRSQQLVQLRQARRPARAWPRPKGLATTKGRCTNRHTFIYILTCNIETGFSFKTRKADLQQSPASLMRMFERAGFKPALDSGRRVHKINVTLNRARIVPKLPPQIINFLMQIISR